MTTLDNLGVNKSSDTQYPIDDLLSARWSPLAFSEKSVEPEKLRSVLEAARWAASSYNEQPWSFIVATKDNPAEFDRLPKNLGLKPRPKKTAFENKSASICDNENSGEAHIKKTK